MLHHTNSVVLRLSQSLHLNISKLYKDLVNLQCVNALVQGFSKSATNRWEFRHDKFQRGRRHLLEEITRKKCQPGMYPSFLKACDHQKVGKGSGAAAEEERQQQRRRRLMEENKTMREENSTLRSEVARYRALYSDLIKWL